LGFLVLLQQRSTEVGRFCSSIPKRRLRDLYQARFEAAISCRIGRGSEILYVTSDFNGNNTTRIATSTRDKIVQTWTFDYKTSTLVPMTSKSYGQDSAAVLPKTLAFDNNPESDLFVFGLYDGGLCVFQNPVFPLANKTSGTSTTVKL
jgi:hypothetical protein